MKYEKNDFPLIILSFKILIISDIVKQKKNIYFKEYYLLCKRTLMTYSLHMISTIMDFDKKKSESTKQMQNEIKRKNEIIDVARVVY